MPVIISNASPLIGLARINLLHVLKELWTEIVIPEAVYKEVVIVGRGKQGARTERHSSLSVPNAFGILKERCWTSQHDRIVKGM